MSSPYVRKLRTGTISSDEALRLKQAELDLLLQKQKVMDLPHLNAFGGRWYKWAREFFESTNKFCFLTAANQSSKSSTQIRKIIHWATEPSLWPKLWNPSVLVQGVPNQFWYLYPTAEVATTEFREKWEPLFMPRGEFKDHPIYGWDTKEERGHVKAIHFKSGVSIYFKTYGQKATDIQSGTCFYMACDEELPIDLFPELQARLYATDGYFSMVFTATLGQLYWENTIQPAVPEDENHKEAFKRQVSLYDCLAYDDGSRSHWTIDRINRIKAGCSTQKECDRRVYGKFVKTEGLLFPSFDRVRNVCKTHSIEGWHVYSAVDPGSGGESGHPTAIIFTAVSPNYQHARIFRGWRGDKIATTSTDILEKWRELRANMRPVLNRYDYEHKDFFMVASRQGESFMPADKSRLSGIGLFNTLLRTGMLKIFEDDPELGKLVSELQSVPAVGDKRGMLDDLCFHGDTLVFTKRGDIPIRDIRLDDLVLTRCGFKPVLAKTIGFSDMCPVVYLGVITWVTPNHKYKLDRGDVCVKNFVGLETAQHITLREKQRLLSTKESYSGDIRTPIDYTLKNTIIHPVTLEKMGWSHCIESFGRTLLEKFLSGLLSIILMATLVIIKLRTWSVLKGPSTCPNICVTPKESLKAESLLKKLKKSHPFGIDPKRVLNFIGNLGSSLGKMLSTSAIFVWLAQMNTKLSNMLLKLLNFALTLVNLNLEDCQAQIISKKLVLHALRPLGQTNIIPQSPALEHVAIRRGGGKKSGLVYNITVIDEHEYFANGILVANCDASRYCLQGIPFDFSHIKIESDEYKRELAVEKKYDERTARRNFVLGIEEDDVEDRNDISDELDFWSEQMEA